MFSSLNRLRYEAAQYKKGLPSIAVLGITERCGLHCKMCRIWLDGDHDEGGELKTDQICRMIDELHDDLGIRRIRLIGGEPFIRGDTVQIIKHAKACGMHVNVVTDGTEITEERADQIVASQLDTIRFSLDGVGKVHERVRGKRDCYRKTAGSIHHIQEAKKRRRVSHPEVQIHSVITTINYDQVLPLWNETRTTFAPSRFLFGPLLEMTPEMVLESIWNEKQLLDDHYVPIGKSLQLSDEQRAVFDAHVRQISGEQESEVPRPLLNWLNRLCARRTRCPESNTLHINRAGYAKICSVYTNYSYGKYPETPVKQIWFSRKHADFMREINVGGSLPVCDEICGRTTRYYVGNPRQLARNLLLRAIPSPLASRGAQMFRFETPDVELKSRREVMEEVEDWRARQARQARPAAPARQANAAGEV
jgi:MoaA/NifB/PqqE/SkfB family radical SAM enzyme